jgi:hypothetical protein
LERVKERIPALKGKSVRDLLPVGIRIEEVTP